MVVVKIPIPKRRENIAADTSAQQLVSESPRFARREERQQSRKIFRGALKQEARKAYTLPEKQQKSLSKSIASYQLKQLKQGPAYLRGQEKIKLARVGRGIAQGFAPASIQQVSGFFGGGITTGQGQQSGGGGSGQGRGRPYSSFTPKMLPDGTIVRMPVQAYKRAVTAMKAQIRLRNELAKQRFSMQPQEFDPYRNPQGYGAPDAEDAFLNMEPQTPMQFDPYAQQMQGYPGQDGMQGQGGFGSPQQPSRWRNFMNNMDRVFAPGTQRVQTPTFSAGSGPTVRMNMWDASGRLQQQRPEGPGTRFTVPKEQNILNTRSAFNNPGGSTLKW